LHNDGGIITRTIVVVCLGLLFAGCALTQQAAVKQSAGRSGLVDYSKLSPGAKGQADLRYVAPATNWTAYRKVIVNPVTFWADQDDAGTSGADPMAARRCGERDDGLVQAARGSAVVLDVGHGTIMTVGDSFELQEPATF
jgi:hypothetical protein